MACQTVAPLLQTLRRAAASLMLLPFVALCLLSPATMLDRDTSGKMVMVLCTGDGPVVMTVDLGTSTPQTKQRCDWAAAHATTIYAAPFALPVLAITTGAVSATLATNNWHPAYDPRNLWARGPPSFV